jgi:putative peptidoglycan lipid II flippase
VTTGSSRLLRANALVAVGTLLSRITGLLRLMLLVDVLGTALIDAYTTANNVPNMVYELVLGGVLTATLVPLFTEHAEHGDREATSAVVTVAGVALLVLTTIATLAAPLIVRLFTLKVPHGVDAGQLRSVMTYLAFFFLPQILFYGLTALAAAMLNARRRYFAAAWAPLLNNLVVIIVLLLLPRLVPVATGGQRDLALAASNGRLRLLLGLGTTAGVAATAIALVPALMGAGVRLNLRLDWHHPAVKRVLRLSGWTLGYVAANQLALYVMTVLARPGSTGVTAYQAAFLVFQLPVGLLAVSVMTTLGPEMARARIRRDRAELLGNVSLGLRAIALVTLPASAGLIALARPLVGLVLQRGSFKAASAHTTAGTLAAFAVSLFCLSAYLFVIRAFYAHDDTKTAFIVNVVENGLNIVFGIVLVGRFGVPGLAWSFTIAYVLASLFALHVLGNKVPGLDVGALARSIGRLAVAAVVTGEVAYLAGRAVGSDHGRGALGRVLVGALAGIGAYVALLLFLRVPELDAVRRLRPGRRGTNEDATGA